MAPTERSPFSYKQCILSSLPLEVEQPDPLLEEFELVEPPTANAVDLTNMDITADEFENQNEGDGILKTTPKSIFNLIQHFIRMNSVRRCLFPVDMDESDIDEQ